MAEFVDNVARVNGLAEQIEGFVWRLQDESGHAMNMRVYDDPRILPNLTLWENVEALERFVWQTRAQPLLRAARGMVRADQKRRWCCGGCRPGIGRAWRKGSSGSSISRRTGRATIAFGWERLSDAQLWKTARGIKIGASRGGWPRRVPLAAVAAE